MSESNTGEIINILIVEDEARIARRIERMISSILLDNHHTITHKESLSEGKTFIKNNGIDLLFLDLNLNGEDGFDVLKSVVSDRFHTIIISAYKDRAITAFEYGVLDFIPKPFTEERLIEAFIRIKAKEDESDYLKYLAVNKKGAKNLINVGDITHIKGADIYAEIFGKNGERYLHNMSLDHLSEVLPPYFERIHRSHIANMKTAKRTITEPGSKYSLELENCTVLPIGRTKYKMIKNKWMI